jgi:FSR family fosmidomycin resistance protein-like MFS transporter
LSYVQVALLFAIPSLAALAVEPLLGVLADRGWRRRLILGGGLVFAATTVGVGIASGFAVLLAVVALAYPASGAFVGLSQGVLMDDARHNRERLMAGWTLVGSVGVVVAPLAVAACLALGGGWRPVFAVLGLGVAVSLLALRGLHLSTGVMSVESFGAGIRSVARLLHRAEVVRWLTLLQATDLMLDVLHGFLALYLVDVAQVGPARAALGVATWTGGGLVGDALLLLILRRLSGTGYLRVSAVLVGAVYPVFLLVQSFAAKLVALALLGVLNAGWYAIPKARLYATVDGRSGAVFALGTVAGAVGGMLPLVIGLVAGAAGLGAALWIPLLAPVALLVWLPSTGGESDSGSSC